MPLLVEFNRVLMVGVMVLGRWEW